MSDENYKTSKELKNLFEDFKEYLELKYDILKLDISERFVLFFSSFYSFFILLVLIPFALFFFSFALAFYLGKILQSPILGFVTVGAIYLVFILVFLIFKGRILNRPLVKAMLSLFFRKNDKDS